VKGQGEFGVIAGISNFQGDLASVSTLGGFRALIGPAFGAHVGIEKTDAFQFRGDLIYTRLSGDDALNDHENSRSRNLSFFLLSSSIISRSGLEYFWIYSRPGH
jgi:hypothetical protein